MIILYHTARPKARQLRGTQELEPAHPVYTYQCERCGFAAAGIHCIYNPITGTTITEEDAPGRALNAWNMRNGSDERGEQLRACPICGTTDAQRTADGRIPLAVIRAKTTHPAAWLERFGISCNKCGCGICATYPAGSSSADVEILRREILHRWNTRNS